MILADVQSLRGLGRRATVALSDVAQRRRSRGPYGVLPLGPPEPQALQLAQFLFLPGDYVRRCRDAFGPFFTLRFPGIPPVVQFHRPDAARDVLTGSPEEYWAGEANLVLEPLLGPNSLLLLDGERHRSQRRLLTPPFRGERMRAYGGVMRDSTLAELAKLREGQPFAFHDLTQAITLDVILRTVFGVEEGAQMEELRHRLSVTVALGARPELMIAALQVDLGPRSPWGRFLEHMRATRRTLLALVRRRRGEDRAGRTDVLSMLLEARHEDGAPMSDDELLDELVTLLLAGHETTATGIAWAAHRLIEHAEVQERLIAELRSAFPDGVVDPERLDEVPYLHAVTQEALRIHPVVPGVGRRLHRDVTIAGVPLPSGVIVGLSVVLAHENPEVFPEPARFRPERFLERKFTPYEYFPFGGGVRRCIGMAFALHEMDVVLATILATHRFVRVPGPRVRTVRRSVTLTPSGGMRLALQRHRA